MLAYDFTIGKEEGAEAEGVEARGSDAFRKSSLVRASMPDTFGCRRVSKQRWSWRNPERENRRDRLQGRPAGHRERRGQWCDRTRRDGAA